MAKMKKTNKQCVTQCVLAGRLTHFRVNGKMLCGSKDKVTGEYSPKENRAGGNILYLMPVCPACIEANVKRWEKVG